MTVPVPNPTQEELDEARVMMERLRAENNGRHAAIRQLGADIAPGFYSSIKIDAFIQFIFARMGNVTPEIRQLLTYQFEISFEQEVAAKLNEMKGEIRKAMLAAPMGMPNGNHTPPSPDGGLWRPGQ